MGNTTKIDWCDASWNPVTGCLHKCEYCYARGIAQRFGFGIVPLWNNGLSILDEPMRREGRIQPYPFNFRPTFHRYKLDEPQHWKKPRTIFVCSMADLFGEWVPDEWIIQVLDACRNAARHRYLFLTKNPNRYRRLAKDDKLPTDDILWYGTSTPRVNDYAFCSRPSCENGAFHHTFVSIEPILERFGKGGDFGTVAMTEWVIVGAETGNRKGRVIPEKEWIVELAEECEKRNKPIFMKESLREIMGEDFRQEYPWDV